MAISVKICGLSTPETVDAAIRHGAAQIGFVFFPKSPRDIEPDRAGSLGSPDGIGRVGVFVAPDDAQLLHTARAARLTAIQLHGDESPARVAAVKTLTGLEVWKAIPVRTGSDLRSAHAYQGAADRILYDARPPEGAHMPGGLGLRFDWRLLDGVRHPLPWLLSGGVDLAGLPDAAGIGGARAVDVSSGVESAPGVKAVDKIAAFLQSASRL